MAGLIGLCAVLVFYGALTQQKNSINLSLSLRAKRGNPEGLASWRYSGLPQPLRGFAMTEIGSSQPHIVDTSSTLTCGDGSEQRRRRACYGVLIPGRRVHAGGRRARECSSARSAFHPAG